MSTDNDSQKRFDAMYITGYEIQKELGVQRSTVLNARNRGLLPEPILIPGVRAFIWEREKTAPYIKAWKISLASRRGQLA